MTDEKGEDEKVLCVPLRDPMWSHVDDIDGIPQPLLNEIEHFFQVYKDLEGHEVADRRVRGPGDRRARDRRGARPARAMTVSAVVAARVSLRHPTPGDRDEFLAARARSRDAARAVGVGAGPDEAFAAYLERRESDRESACSSPGTTTERSSASTTSARSARRIPERLPRLLRVRAVRGPRYMREAPCRSCSARLRPARAPPAGGEHPAGQRAVPRAGRGDRLPPGGILAALPQDRRSVARPRACGDHRRGVPPGGAQDARTKTRAGLSPSDR